MRRILLTAFALMVLLPSIAFAGRSEYLCRFDGKVRSACCCPATTHAQEHAQEAKQEPPAPTSLRGACCCTIVEIAPARAHDAAENQVPGARSHVPAVVVSAPLPLAALLVVSSVAPLRRSLAPPEPPRSLFVRHCAWLL